jgi:agmatine/peptidylarginine deiminase
VPIESKSESWPEPFRNRTAITDYLGVSEILWLGDGIEGDDTDGHIDDLARFVDERTIVTVVEEKQEDANHKPLQENLARLRAMKWKGSPFEIITLPMPAKIVRRTCVYQPVTRTSTSQMNASCYRLSTIQTMPLRNRH